MFRKSVPLFLVLALCGSIQGQTFLGKGVVAWMTDLDSNDAGVRRSAAYALGKLGKDAADARPALEAALRDDQPAVRQNVAWALGKLGPKAVPALREALRDRDDLVKRDAINSLGQFKDNTEAVRPA